MYFKNMSRIEQQARKQKYKHLTDEQELYHIKLLTYAFNRILTIIFRDHRVKHKVAMLCQDTLKNNVAFVNTYKTNDLVLIRENAQILLLLHNTENDPKEFVRRCLKIQFNTYILQSFISNFKASEKNNPHFDFWIKAYNRIKGHFIHLNLGLAYGIAKKLSNQDKLFEVIGRIKTPMDQKSTGVFCFISERSTTRLVFSAWDRDISVQI